MAPDTSSLVEVHNPCHSNNHNPRISLEVAHRAPDNEGSRLTSAAAAPAAEDLEAGGGRTADPLLARPSATHCRTQGHAPEHPPGHVCTSSHSGSTVDGNEVINLDIDIDEHVHFSHRSPWLRAFVLGANDGLVSVAALMLGVGGGSSSLGTMRLAGLAAWIAGALSMACGEFISVSSQKDTELADIEKERQMQAKGPVARARELEELTQIYVKRGLDYALAKRVAEQLTEKDVIRAHARDELGIDIDVLANPLQAAVVSSLAFTAGAIIPLLAGSFIQDSTGRLISVAITSCVGLALFGLAGSALGGARLLVGALRVLIGGALAMAVTYAVGLALGAQVA